MDRQKSNKVSVSRRSFIVGASAAAMGVAASAALGGCSPQQNSNAVESAASESDVHSAMSAVWSVEELHEPDDVKECDLCIVGAGGVGLAAAIQATQLGMNVVVVEKKGTTGGTFIGSEGLFAVGSHWQEEAGETLTLEEAKLSCLEYHHWIPNPELYDNYFKRTADTIIWLEDLGVEFDHVQSFCSSPICWHVYKGNEEQGTGIQFMKSFGEAANKLGIDIELECSGKKLIVEDGVVKGVLCERADKSVLRVNAGAVVVGTGGYANNPDMIEELNGSDPGRITASGMDGRDADGLKMMRDAGADMAQHPGTMMFYGPIMPGSTYGTQLQAATSMQPHLWVNQDGIRFTREDMFIKNFAHTGNAVFNQKRAFTVCNEALLDLYEQKGGFVDVGVYCKAGVPMSELKQQLQQQIESKNEFLFQAETIDDLATAMGVSKETLSETVEHYNQCCAAGKDDQFDKPASYLLAIEQGPYYAFEVYNGYFTTVGGIRISPRTEVVGRGGDVIPGLYAGGSDAGGLYGDTYDVSYAAGSQASWAINSGRMAAKYAAEYLGFEVDPDE